MTPFDPDAPLPDLHIPVRGLGIETVEEVEDDECMEWSTTGPQ